MNNYMQCTGNEKLTEVKKRSICVIYSCLDAVKLLMNVNCICDRWRIFKSKRKCFD